MMRSTRSFNKVTWDRLWNIGNKEEELVKLIEILSHYSGSFSFGDLQNFAVNIFKAKGSSASFKSWLKNHGIISDIDVNGMPTLTKPASLVADGVISFKSFVLMTTITRPLNTKINYDEKVFELFVSSINEKGILSKNKLSELFDSDKNDLAINQYKYVGIISSSDGDEIISINDMTIKIFLEVGRKCPSKNIRDWKAWWSNLDIQSLIPLLSLYRGNDFKNYPDTNHSQLIKDFIFKDSTLSEIEKNRLPIKNAALDYIKSSQCHAGLDSGKGRENRSILKAFSGNLDLLKLSYPHINLWKMISMESRIIIDKKVAITEGVSFIDESKSTTKKNKKGRKVDWLKKAKTSSDNGARAEEAILKYLKGNKSVDQDTLMHSSVIDGDGLGYDIKYKYKNTDEWVYVEVKSSTSAKRFFLSDNELSVAMQEGEQYHIYFLYWILDSYSLNILKWGIDVDMDDFIPISYKSKRMSI